MFPVHTRFKQRATVLTIAALCLGYSSMSRAQNTDESKVKLTGFLSVTAGRVTSGKLGDDYTGQASIVGVQCPCYSADWSNAGVYGKRFTLGPESRAGLQATYAVNDKLSLVGQVVARASTEALELTWAYASYEFAQDWEFQLGRKRIPLYFYSDFQDVGVAYPWVSPPPELYGWEANNYNGVSLRHRFSMGDASMVASVFAGREDIDKSQYYKLLSDEDTKVTWKNLLGADLEISRDALTLRAVYVGADTEANGNPAKLTAFGVAANLDYNDWFALSELTQQKRDFSADGYSYTVPAFTVGFGMRLGRWTPFVNYAQYKERSSDDSLYEPQSYKRSSVSLRYDLDPSSNVKAQFDRHRDVTRNYGGDVTVFRITYDRVF